MSTFFSREVLRRLTEAVKELVFDSCFNPAFSIVTFGPLGLGWKFLSGSDIAGSFSLHQ